MTRLLIEICVVRRLPVVRFEAPSQHQDRAHREAQ